MEERKIIESSSQSGPPELREVDQFFTKKEFLTQEDINAMAEKLCLAIIKVLEPLDQELLDTIALTGHGYADYPVRRDNMKVAIIFKVLNAYDILINDTSVLSEAGFTKELLKPTDPRSATRLGWKDSDGFKQSDIITGSELEKSLHEVRVAVLEELWKILPPQIKVNISIEEIKNHVFSLEKNEIFKRQKFGIPHLPYLEALTYLCEVIKKEDTPYIFKNLHMVDRRDGALIVGSIPLTTIENIINKSEKPSLEKILKYFIDIIEGHKFLMRNNLMLSDNSLKNLGVNTLTDQGVLFDLDGLRKKNQRTSYLRAKDYTPPELNRKLLNRVITESNVVYELGVALRKVLNVYSINNSYDQNDHNKAILKLVDNMQNDEPEKRPKLNELSDRLKKLIPSTV